MKLDRFIRVALGLLIFVVFLVAIGGLLFFTQTALNVWDRLTQGPAIFRYVYAGVMLALFVAAVYLVWRLLVRRPVRAVEPPSTDRLTRSEIEDRLRHADAVGVDVVEAQAELRELAERQESGAIHLCFFGEISTGKSSLIKALVPEADVRIDVAGGSTVEVRHYRWRNDQGTEVRLTDVPGTGGHDEGLDDIALEEARRAHVVLYVGEGDLNRAEAASIARLLELDKPMILVMNKSDRYTHEEQATLLQRLLERLDILGGDVRRDRIVAVSAGGVADIVERRPDGSETVVRRRRPADIGVLVVAINRLLEAEAEPIDVRRNRAVFRLAAEKLAEAEEQYRAQRSEQIIRNATRRAVIGALAAVSPGTDILIQGYVGTTMTRELCKLYGAAPRDLDIEEFLNLSQSRVGNALPLTLAVAGNGLKAFPGIGTVAGGLVHAVAYGLIFDALGRSLMLTLSKHGELMPDQAAQEFEEGIGERLEAGVRRVAKMALAEKAKGR